MKCRLVFAALAALSLSSLAWAQAQPPPTSANGAVDVVFGGMFTPTSTETTPNAFGNGSLTGSYSTTDLLKALGNMAATGSTSGTAAPTMNGSLQTGNMSSGAAGLSGLFSSSGGLTNAAQWNGFLNQGGAASFCADPSNCGGSTNSNATTISAAVSGPPSLTGSVTAGGVSNNAGNATKTTTDQASSATANQQSSASLTGGLIGPLTTAGIGTVFGSSVFGTLPQTNVTPSTFFAGAGVKAGSAYNASTPTGTGVKGTTNNTSATATHLGVGQVSATASTSNMATATVTPPAPSAKP